MIKPEQAARAVTLMKLGVEAYEAAGRDAALSAFSEAWEIADEYRESVPALAMALDDATTAVRRGDRRGLMAAMTKALGVIAPPPPPPPPPSPPPPPAPPPPRKKAPSAAAAPRPAAAKPPAPETPSKAASPRPVTPDFRPPPEPPPAMAPPAEAGPSKAPPAAMAPEPASTAPAAAPPAPPASPMAEPASENTPALSGRPASAAAPAAPLAEPAPAPAPAAAPIATSLPVDRPPSGPPPTASTAPAQAAPAPSRAAGPKPPPAPPPELPTAPPEPPAAPPLPAAAPEPPRPPPAASEPAAPVPKTPPPRPAFEDKPPAPKASARPAPQRIAPPPRVVLLLGEAEHAALRGDLTAALLAAEEAAALSRGGNGHEDQPTSNRFSRVGELLANARQWRAAFDLLTVALTIKTRLHGRSNRRIAPDLTQLSALAERLGDYDAARSFAERDLSIRRLQSNGKPADLAVSLANLGRAALGMEDFASAAQALREALAISRDIAAPGAVIAGLLDHLAVAVAPLEGDDAARALHEEGFALRRASLDPQHPDLARSLLHTGGYLLTADAPDEAESRFRAALEIFEARGAEEAAAAAACMAGLAMVNARRNNLRPARRILRDALERARNALGAGHKLAVGQQAELAYLTFFTGDLAQAQSLAREALLLSRRPQGATVRRDLWHLLSLLAAARGETAAAVVFAKLTAIGVQREPGARSVATPLRRLFGTRPGDCFRHLAAVCGNAGRLAEASRALAMLKEDELFELRRRDPALDPRESMAALNTAEAAWLGWGEEIFRSLAELDEEQANPRPRSAAEIAALNWRQADHAERLKSWLDDAEADCAAGAPGPPFPGLAVLGARVGLLQIIAGADRLRLLLSTSDLLIDREVNVTAPALSGLVREFRAALAARAESVRELGGALHDHLIAPVIETIRDRGIKTLLIGADGPLRYLPFAALHDGSRYLAETLVTVLFTEAAPEAPAPVWPENTTTAAFGATRLPGHEAARFDEEVKTLFRNAESGGMYPGQLTVDEAFDIAALSEGLASHQLIHLAAPTVLDAERPADSFMLLGDGSRLRLADVVKPPFYFRDVALMTFTGCETAPQAGGGGEIESLGALLRRRGAKSVMVSLWRPLDAPAPSLLAAFYGQYRDGKTAGAALNAAQRMILGGPAAHRHPYFWSQYVVLGGVE